MKNFNINIEEHFGIKILRDDKLIGGTKSRFLTKLLDSSKEGYVYASPVYGGFQIALTDICKKINKKAVIFCAKRKEPHINSLKVKQLGGRVLQIPYGYLSNIQSKAKKFANDHNYQLLEFGAKNPTAINEIAKTTKNIINILGKEPQEIWCAVGSGTLVEGILKGSVNAKILGVQIGKEYNNKHPRLTILKYHKPFEKISNFKAPFQSCQNYDLKALEYCIKFKKSKEVLFWNVL